MAVLSALCLTAYSQTTVDVGRDWDGSALISPSSGVNLAASQTAYTINSGTENEVTFSLTGGTVPSADKKSVYKNGVSANITYLYINSNSAYVDINIDDSKIITEFKVNGTSDNTSNGTSAAVLYSASSSFDVNDITGYSSFDLPACRAGVVAVSLNDMPAETKSVRIYRYIKLSASESKYVINEEGDIVLGNSVRLPRIAYISVTIEDAAPPTEPTIGLITTNNTQTVYPTQNIKDIVYKWGGNATGATVAWTAGSVPEGISVDTDNDNKSVTIKGAPTTNAASAYEYTISSTDGTKTSEVLTGTITVKVTSLHKLAYITTVTNGEADSRDKILFESIKEKFDINVIDATEVGVDYSIYDIVALSAVPNSGSAGILAGSTAQAAALNKPFVQMKTFLVNSSRWQWVGTAANEPSYTNATREVTLTSAGLAHNLFYGVTVSAENKVKLIDDAYDFATSGNNGIVTFDEWNTNLTQNASNAPIILAEADSKGSYAEIQVGTQIGANAENVTQYPVLLLGLSEASWNNLTADAKTIVVNALRYVVNDTFSVGISDKNTDNNNKVVATKEYYDMMGKKLSAKPINTIAIEKVIYEDGSIEFVKVRYTK